MCIAPGQRNHASPQNNASSHALAASARKRAKTAISMREIPHFQGKWACAPKPHNPQRQTTPVRRAPQLCGTHRGPSAHTLRHAKWPLPGPVRAVCGGGATDATGAARPPPVHVAHARHQPSRTLYMARQTRARTGPCSHGHHVQRTLAGAAWALTARRLTLQVATTRTKCTVCRARHGRARAALYDHASATSRGVRLARLLGTMWPPHGPAALSG